MTLHGTFAALGDPVRLAIVERLLKDGETKAGDLIDVADISAPAVSRHLKVLRQAGVIDQRVDGQKRLYRANPKTVQNLHEWTTNHKAFWESSLDRLEKVLSEKGDKK